MNLHRNERGAINGLVVAISLVGLAAVALAALSVWLFIQYNEQKTNVDGKIAVAEAEARRAQSETDEQKFSEREKEPNREFVGPDDYGRLTFSYPKTWSVYVDNDASRGGVYEAYLNPVTVPPVNGAGQRFATRVVIEDKDYDQVLSTYESRVKAGELKSSTVSANGTTGTRYDGEFSKDIRGSVVIFKLRDKTISLFTDANTFKPDFDKLIKTIGFNR